MIELKYCRVFIEPYGVLTVFDDGSTTSSWARSDYRQTSRAARACRFDSVVDYVRDRDLSLSFFAEKFEDRPSPLLWALAHGAALAEAQVIAERRRIYRWQRFVHAGARPDARSTWGQAKIEYRTLLFVNRLPLGSG